MTWKKTLPNPYECTSEANTGLWWSIVPNSCSLNENSARRAKENVITITLSCSAIGRIINVLVILAESKRELCISTLKGNRNRKRLGNVILSKTFKKIEGDFHRFTWNFTKFQLL